MTENEIGWSKGDGNRTDGAHTQGIIDQKYFKTFDEVVNFVKAPPLHSPFFLSFGARRWQVNVHFYYHTPKYVGCHLEEYSIAF